MAFLADLIESFVPTLAFADNEEEVKQTTEEPVAEESSTIDPTDEKVAEEAKTEETVETGSPSEEAEAAEEAPVAEESTKAAAATEEEPSTEEEPTTEESTEEEASEASEEEGEEEEDEEEEDEEEEDEDEDEEEGAGDQLDKLREECSKKAEIQPYVHHYAECVERVTAAQQQEGYEDLEYKEDCVEEFFHLQHHLNDCVAPRLFYKLK